MHKYLQIADLIRAQIAKGELAPGSAVPSEVTLMEKYGVARQTVRKAIALLKREDVLYSLQGHGTYVGPPSVPREERDTKLYRHIADDIIGQIRAGTLKPDRPIPSEKQMAQHYEVANGTARQAVALLRELGWVQTVPQKGTFVVPRGDWPKS